MIGAGAARARARWLAAAVVGLWLLPSPGTAAETHDAAYWVDRMEAALLPKSTMRARFALESATRPRTEMRGYLTRVQGPTQIRTVFAVERPDRERLLLAIGSTPEGDLQRALYVAGDSPLRLRVERSAAFLSTAFSYDDLGFIEQRKTDVAVSEEDLPTGRVIRLTRGAYGPYGRVELRLDPKTALPRRVEYYDRDGKLLRTVTYGDLRKHGLFSFPHRIEAVDANSGRRSTLRLEDVELGAEVYEHEFSAEALADEIRKITRRPSPY